MKTVLLHYWLVNRRGGENVLASLCGIFPDAEIYTHAWNPERVGEPFRNHRVHETFIGSLPFAGEKCQIYLPLMPYALSRIHPECDLLFSSESGPAKGVRKPAGAKHICYCHTPMRYLWDMYDDYYRASGFAGRLSMRLFRDYLRKYDLKSAEGVDSFLANSSFVAERIRRIYGRESEVIHPPVDTAFYSAAKREGPKDYYLFAGQLTGYKRPDLAVRACERMNRKLVAAGGAADGFVRKSAPGVEFAGWCSREKLRSLYAGAKALIFPGIEDFGIVPVEAMAAGTPVIAFGRGGALDTVHDGETGVLFGEQTVESLCGAIERFEGMRFDSDGISRAAEAFSMEVFDRKIREHVRKMIPGAEL